MSDDSDVKFPTVGEMEAPDAMDLDQLGKCAKWYDDQCAEIGKKLAIHRFPRGIRPWTGAKEVPHGQWGTSCGGTAFPSPAMLGKGAL